MLVLRGPDNLQMLALALLINVEKETVAFFSLFDSIWKKLPGLRR